MPTRQKQRHQQTILQLHIRFWYKTIHYQYGVKHCITEAVQAMFCAYESSIFFRYR